MDHYEEIEPLGQLKSKDRVRDLAEVFTADREVNAMLDLLGDASYNIEFRYLEPSCGNGNFLVAIFERKMRTVGQKYRKLQDFEFYTLVALSSIYGVDIAMDNVKEARQRLKNVVVDRFSDVQNSRQPTDGFYKSIDYVLKHNVTKGDMVNDEKKIKFTEFTSPKLYKLKQSVYRYVDLLSSKGTLWADSPEPIEEVALKNYWELASDV